MSTKPLSVLVIVASVRPTRRADEVLAWWQDLTAEPLAALGAVARTADLREMSLHLDGEPDVPHTGQYALPATREWSRTVAAADAFVVLTCEYNHAMPGSLKDAFDALHAEWQGKPVAWVSYGNTSAGTRALLSAKQVTTTLGMTSVGPDIALRLTDWPDDVMPADPVRDELAVAALTALVAHAHALGTLRTDDVEVIGLPPGLRASRATARDADELLVLQRCCWVDEAMANETLDIPALHDTVEDLRRAIEERDCLVVRHGGRLVASIQTWAEGTDWHIGRLMVSPDQRRRGLARVLLRHAEAAAPDRAQQAVLSTGSRSSANISRYRGAGFEPVAAPSGGVVTLSKALGPTMTVSLSG